MPGTHRVSVLERAAKPSMCTCILSDAHHLLCIGTRRSSGELKVVRPIDARAARGAESKRAAQDLSNARGLRGAHLRLCAGARHRCPRGHRERRRAWARSRHQRPAQHTKQGNCNHERAPRASAPGAVVPQYPNTEVLLIDLSRLRQESGVCRPRAELGWVCTLDYAVLVSLPAVTSPYSRGARRAASSRCRHLLMETGVE